MAEKLGASAVLAELKDWAAVDDGRDAIRRTYQFPDFKSAFAFMSGVALKAEELNHHPEWVNVYGRVEVTLTTHDASGVTQLDRELGRFMDDLAGRLRPD